MTKLILIRGLPGSGKSTIANLMTECHHVEADHFFLNAMGEYEFNPAKLPMAHEACFLLTKALLEEHNNVVVANTFSRQWEIQPYLDLAKKMGIQPILIEAKGNFKSIHNVPEEAIQRMKDRWEQITL